MQSIKSLLVLTLRALRRARRRLAFRRHRPRLQAAVDTPSPEYDAYLDTQLSRTLLKTGEPLQARTRFLVDTLATYRPLDRSQVLCVGCRNREEVNYFQQKGVKEVVGIDLYSQWPEILVMDMHRMTFPDDRFDIVYSSHSLEHAYDPAQVAREIIRVARPGATVVVEVPVRFETRGADLVDLGSKESLLALFEPHVAELLWSEEQPLESLTNHSGTPIARAIFTITKPGAARG